MNATKTEVRPASEPRQRWVINLPKLLPRGFKEFLIERLIWLAGISTILLVGLIFFFLIREGLPHFS
jgi:hypothetical protein